MIDLKTASAEFRVKRAKIKMYEKSPFFSFVLMKMNVQENKEIPSMAVDYKGNILYNPDWVKTLNEDELQGVVAHELLHLCLLHLMRRGTRNAEIFNISNDLVANNLLLKDSFHLPKCGLIPSCDQFDMAQWGIKHIIKDIDKKSSEEIYDEIYPLLPKRKIIVEFGDGESGDGEGEPDDFGQDGSSKDGKKKSKKNGSGNGKEIRIKVFDKHEYGDLPKEEKEKAERETKQVLVEAATYAKMRGKLPSHLERLVDGLLESKVSWKEFINKYVIARIPFDYDYTYPSKRSMALGVFLPRMKKESVEMVVAIDTSGSIGQEELKEFISEIVAICNAFNSVKMKLIVCDADIHETYDITNDNMDDLISMKMSGGGGTDHKIVMDYIQNELPDTKLVIAFTDGATNFGEMPETFDVLWALSKNSVNPKDIPWGEVVKIE